MGREAAHWILTLSPRDAEAVVARLDAGGLQRGTAAAARTDFLVRDPHRYWIDVRVHHPPRAALEVRVALTNDTWTIREPLERALTPLAPTLDGRTWRDEDGVAVATFGAEGWAALVDDYARRRDAFVARVGDFNAPLSADHVYMYVHQTRWNRDNDEELAWHREREIARLEEAWDA